jgi:pyridoxamine 5'-phosphate oxidase
MASGTTINNKTFSEETIDPDPFIQFKLWYDEHLASVTGIPEAVTLATGSPDGHISARTVLLKDYDESGFVFYTNYSSRKGSQLSSNPRMALLFYWPESGRQVRIEGITEKIPENESVEYFHSRPRESQLSACASKQSSVIPDREHLNTLFKFYEDKYSGGDVEKPAEWGGFRVIPEWFEFWQNGEYRLHDRLTYTRTKNKWLIERLAP